MTGYFADIASGRRTVCEHGHTLILGWSEATPRLVCQIAHVRADHAARARRELCSPAAWLRGDARARGVRRPVATGAVVVLADAPSKPEMDAALTHAFSEHRVDTRATRPGVGVLTCAGDPTSMHELVRVGATRAAAVLLSLRSLDDAQADASDGAVQHGATVGALLALRHVLLTGCCARLAPGLRIVVEVSALRVALTLLNPSSCDIVNLTLSTWRSTTSARAATGAAHHNGRLSSTRRARASRRRTSSRTSARGSCARSTSRWSPTSCYFRVRRCQGSPAV